MTESKLQYLARSLTERITTAEGTERETLITVLADVRWLMGQDVTVPENDPVYWFDGKGRFCARAQSKEEIESDMILMAIADGVSLDAVCRKNPDLGDWIRDWNAFQEMKLKYMEACMRVQELEEQIKEVSK